MTGVAREPTGDCVRRALAEAGVKQVEAAAALDISQGQLSRRIRGRIEFRAHELQAIAELCKVPVATLLADRERAVA